MRWGTSCLMLSVVALLAATGCHTAPQHPSHFGPYGATGRTLPVPTSDVPGELHKIALPPYVIEPPDQILIEVVAVLEDPDAAATRKPSDPPKEFKAFSLPVQPVSGQFSVRPDGSVYLGIWGSVPVAGLTLPQAAEAVRDHIARQEDPTKPGTGGFRKETIRVVLDVLQYNSKRYYVVTDGGGNGETVTAFPITGSETVFDAIANIGGLPPVASKRHIWVARRTPHAGQPEQILPVDWVAITQHGLTTTNYQVMPGDRIYVKAQKLVRIDTTLARVLTPIERLLGIPLLASTTYNQIAGRGAGFNNNR